MFKMFKKKEPITINDVYGVLTLDKDYNTYIGEIDWLGEKAEFNLVCDYPYNVDISLDYFHSIMKNALNWDQKLRQYSVEAVVNNDNMIEIEEVIDNSENNHLITRENFLSRMKLDYVYIFPDDRLAFNFKLSGMFKERNMAIEADISGEIVSASLTY